MEQAYWLGRKRASAANAKSAGSAEARLVHLDLAGRYSIKAAAAVHDARHVQLALPQPGALECPPQRAEADYEGL